MQAAKAAPSRLHWKVELSSLELKRKKAFVLFVRLAGPSLTAVCGGVVSSVNVRGAVQLDWLPAASAACAAQK